MREGYRNQTVDPMWIIKPESSDWRMRVCGITYIPTKGNEPNWFHRLMQRWAFGFRWERRS